ncbi:Ni/Fe hydrogenase subunit alpha [Candidatus Venteria ishoeyi]|uniref:Ni/Fe hydrogenase subunit alpha n=1 Tax=Candidatus Venteria ishoeyi TaxID=1899563 RepID=UPI0025A52C6B|nr:Ni/Fe hydrogenase subunit alpha [Candidatus Venteria ishoeyi]MDM8547998.1 Ni/Fe hydrogenase subunit alpha [Candidatus Venteria ishoeyi]
MKQTNSHRDLRINVPVLARVEGEGALELDISQGEIKNLKLRIFEPPRLFEKFVEGYHHTDLLDMVARICGICPVAYQMSAVQALEKLFGHTPTPWVSDMRRVMYCGEWLQSHSLHIHLLAAPDFLGFDNAIAMAKDFPQEVRRGLSLQGLGNDLMVLFGARSVHPVGICVGGFYHAPEAEKVAAIRARLQAALPQAEALVHWCAGLKFPQDEQSFISVALRHPDEYAIYAGDLVSDQGLNVPIEDYAQHFQEFQSPHSTALHAALNGQPYLVGPLARLNLNLEQLPDTVRSNLEATGITFPSKMMFHSILARAVELHFILLEALRLLKDYEVPEQSRQIVEPVAGTATGASEAPRGLLWHQYQVDAEGRIQSATIIPPTSQNQARMEQDIALSLQNYGLEHTDEQLRLHAEQVIRNYDPCISCATHFLQLKIRR